MASLHVGEYHSRVALELADGCADLLLLLLPRGAVRQYL